MISQCSRYALSITLNYYPTRSKLNIFLCLLMWLRCYAHLEIGWFQKTSIFKSKFNYYFLRVSLKSDSLFNETFYKMQLLVHRQAKHYWLPANTKGDNGSKCIIKGRLKENHFHLPLSGWWFNLFDWLWQTGPLQEYLSGPSTRHVPSHLTRFRPDSGGASGVGSVRANGDTS